MEFIHGFCETFNRCFLLFKYNFCMMKEFTIRKEMDIMVCWGISAAIVITTIAFWNNVR